MDPTGNPPASPISPRLARVRARVIRAVRDHLDDRGYLEVDTPLLAPSLIPERYIDPFTTDLRRPGVEPRRLGLVPSPELYMKQLLAEGFGNIYQLGHVFRNVERLSPQHNPEFTMLEWYTTGADYHDSIDHTRALLETIATELAEVPGAGPDVGSGARPEAARVIGSRAPETVSVAEAFHRYAGIDPAMFHRPDGMREAAESVGLRTGPHDTAEELFQRVFLSCVETALPDDRPVFLTDYPALVPTLAAPADDPAFSQRWELYLRGVEIANCYTEERDPGRIERFMRSEAARIGAEGKSNWRTTFPAELLSFGNAPPCSGVALGVDRLLAVLLGLDSIEGVIFFPGFSIFREPPNAPR
jgi:lysyl-tRNA synthetase class 2